MDLPVMPPVSPMLAKSVPEIPGRRPRRAQVGRLPLRSSSGTATRWCWVAQRAADDPVLPRGRRGGPREHAASGACSTARSWSRAATGSTSRRCSCGSTPRPAGSRLLAARDAGVLGRLRPARDRGRGPHGAPVPRAPGAAAWRPSRRRGAGPRHPRDRRHGLGPRVVPAFEGAGLDGVVAKPLDVPYQPDKRVMFKVKHDRTADCVVAGFRWHKSGPVVGSLLLGLYREGGSLQHVGVAASFPMAGARACSTSWSRTGCPRAAQPPPGTPGATGRTRRRTRSERMPGNVSRWNSGKDLSFVPLRPDLVVEVALRPDGGRPVPAHGAVPPVAHRTGRRSRARTSSSTGR